jgi:hypothetical protein
MFFSCETTIISAIYNCAKPTTKVEGHFYNTDHIPSDVVVFLGTHGIFAVSLPISLKACKI